MSASSTASLDETIHNQTRLKILAALSTRDIEYTDLKTELDLSDGAMSTATRKLDEAKYIKPKKRLHDGKTKTTYSITPKGRAAFEDYIIRIRAIIDAVPTLDGTNIDAV